MDLPSVHDLAILLVLGTVAYIAHLAGYSWRNCQVSGLAPSAVWAVLIAARGVVSGIMTPL